MVKPHISIILPTYNRVTYIPRALDSVLAQTYQDIEIIIVDDHSTDETIEILSTYSDPRIRVLRHEQNRGAAAARNTGFLAAKSDLIAFQDSDDVWLPHKLQLQLDGLEENSGTRAGYCAMVRVGQDGVVLIPTSEAPGTSGWVTPCIRRTNVISTQTLLVTRELLERVGGFDESLKALEDWELILRLSRETPFSFISEPLVMVYETAGNITSFKLNHAKARMHILNKLEEIFSDVPDEYARHYLIAARIFLECGRRNDALLAMQAAISATPFAPLMWGRLLKAGYFGLVKGLVNK